MADDVEVKFGADISDFEPSLNQLRFALEGLTNPLRAIRSTLGDVGDAFIAAFAVDKLITFTEEMTKLGLSVQNVAQQLGESVEEVTRFQALAESVGVSGDQATNALERLARGLSQTAQNGSPAQRAMEALGISFKDAQGNIQPLQDLLPEIAQKFSTMADGPNKTALAIALFGRAGADMIPILDKGTAGIQAMAEEADRLGVTMGQVAVSGMVAVGNQTNEMSEAFEGLKNKTFAAMQPLLLSLLETVNSLIEKFGDWATSFSTFEEVWDPLSTSLKEVGEAIWGVLSQLADLFMQIWNLGDASDHASTTTSSFKTVLQDTADDVTQFAASMRLATADIQYFIDNASGLIDELRAIGFAGAGMFDQARIAWKQGTDEQAAAIKKYNDQFNTIMTDELEEQIKGRTSGFLDWETNQIKNFTTMLDNLPMAGGKQAPGLGDGGAEAQKIADTKLKIKEQEAQEEIQLEAQKNQTLFALGEENLQTYIQQAEKEAGQKLEAEVEFYNAKALADAKDKAKVMEDLAGRQKAYNDYYIAIGKLHETYILQSEKDEAALVDLENSEDDKRLAAGITALENKYKAHKMTVEQEAAAEIQLTNDILKQEIVRLEMLQEGLDAGSDAYLKYEKQIEDIQARITTATAKANNAVTESYTQTADKIASAMTGALTNMLTSTETWQQQVINILNKLVNVFMTSIVEPMLKQWIAGEMAQVAATQTAESLKTAAKTEGAAEANAAGLASSLKTITADAAKAFSGVYAWASPIMGPFAAIPAAAAFTAVLAMESLASAEGGMEVNSDQLAMVHEDEMILPPSLSDGIRGMIAGGGSSDGSSGGDHYTFNIQAVDAQSVQRLFTTQGSALVQALNRQRRNMNSSLSRGLSPS